MAGSSFGTADRNYCFSIKQDRDAKSLLIQTLTTLKYDGIEAMLAIIKFAGVESHLLDMSVLKGWEMNF